MLNQSYWEETHTELFNFKSEMEALVNFYESGDKLHQYYSELTLNESSEQVMKDFIGDIAANETQFYNNMKRMIVAEAPTNPSVLASNQIFSGAPSPHI